MQTGNPPPLLPGLPSQRKSEWSATWSDSRSHTCGPSPLPRCGRSSPIAHRSQSTGLASRLARTHLARWCRCRSARLPARESSEPRLFPDYASIPPIPQFDCLQPTRLITRKRFHEFLLLGSASPFTKLDGLRESETGRFPERQTRRDV